MNEKFIKKYMRIAKVIGEDQNPCYSRQIGVVIVNPEENRIVGTGYNGPPKGTLHCDDYNYLEQIVYPMMSEQDKEKINAETHDSAKYSTTFARQFAGCRNCPRKLLGYKSGEKSNMCSCQHAERNAITNSNGATNGCSMFCWCGVPCWECTGAVINAGIKNLYLLKWPKDYDERSRWLLNYGKVKIKEFDEEYFR